MKKYYIIAASSLLVLLFVSWLVSKQTTPEPVTQTPAKQTEKLQVTSSFYPLAFLVEAVGGDRVEVINMTPAGAEPHDFEPTPKDLVELYNSKLVVFNGAGMEPWLEKITPDLASKNILLLNASESVNLHKIDVSQEEADHGSHDDHNHTSLDPHFWLDTSLSSEFAKSISTSLSQLRPEFKEEFNQRLLSLQSRLASLDSAYKTGLAACQSKDIIVSHQAYNYLAKRYNINMYSISGISPEAEPSPSKLKTLSDLARSKNIGFVFFESLASPAVSQTLAREIGGQTLVLNPIEGLTSEEVKLGKNYFNLMEENLTNLRTALKCQ